MMHGGSQNNTDSGVLSISIISASGLAKHKKRGSRRGTRQLSHLDIEKAGKEETRKLSLDMHLGGVDKHARDAPGTSKLLRGTSEFLQGTAARLSASGKIHQLPSAHCRVTVFDVKKNRTMAEFKTTVQKRTVTPVWNETFQVLLENVDLSSVQLKLEIFHRRSLGMCVIPLHGLLLGNVAEAFPLKAAEKTLKAGGGEIYAALSFTSETRAIRTSVTTLPTAEAMIASPPRRKTFQIADEYSFDLNMTESNLRFEWAGEGAYTVTAASFVKLVELMTWPESALGTDAQYDVKKLITDVALALPMLCSFERLLQLLILRYRGPPPAVEGQQDNLLPRQRLVFLENRAEIQAGVTFVLQHMFATTHVMSRGSSVPRALTKALEELRSWAPVGDPLRGMLESLETLTTEIGRLRVDNLERSTYKTVSTASIVLELRASDIAEQWCLMEHSLFCNIMPDELVSQAWAKRSRECAGMTAYTKWVNCMARWVASEIIQQSTAPQRALIIGNFIEIALLLRQFNNIGGMMEVLAGLSIAAVDRLRDSWQLVPSQLRTSHVALEKLLSAKSNFRMYREMMAIVVPPYIPFIGTHLTDLTYIDEGNVTLLEPGLYNVEKVELIAGTVRVFDRAGSKNYPFKPLQSVQKLLKDVRALDEEELYRLSLMREPRKGESTATSPRRRGGTSKIFKKHTRKTVLRSAFNTNAEFFQVGEFTNKDMDFLFSGTKITPLSKGQALCYAGDVVDFCSVVVRGELYTETTVGEERLVTLYTKGELVMGLGVMFEKYVVPLTIRATNDGCSIRRVRHSAVHASLEHKPEFAQRFYLKLARTLGKDLDELNHTKGFPKGTRRQLYPLNCVGKTEGIQAEFNLPTDDQANFERFEARWKGEPGQLFITNTAVCFKCIIFQAVTRTVTRISSIKEMNLKRSTILQLQVSEPEPHILEYDFVHQRTAIKALSLLKSRRVETQDGPALPAFIHRDKSLETLDAYDAFTITRVGPKNISVAIEGATPLQFTLTSHVGDPEAVLPKLMGYFERMVAPQKSVDRVAAASSGAGGGGGEDDGRKNSVLSHAGLTGDDWTLILAGAHTRRAVRGGAPLVESRRPLEALYRVDAGCCQVVNDAGAVLARIPQGEIFGETSFLHGSGYTPNVSVVAATDICTVTSIHHHFLGILFSMQPVVAGRFFKHLCSVLISRVIAMLGKLRIKERQQKQMEASTKAQLYGKQKIPKFVMKTPVRSRRSQSPTVPPEMLARSPNAKRLFHGDDDAGADEDSNSDELALQVSEGSTEELDTSEELEEDLRAASTSSFPGIKLRKKNSLFSMSMESL